MRQSKLYRRRMRNKTYCVRSKTLLHLLWQLEICHRAPESANREIRNGVRLTPLTEFKDRPFMAETMDTAKVKAVSKQIFILENLLLNKQLQSRFEHSYSDTIRVGVW